MARFRTLHDMRAADEKLESQSGKKVYRCSYRPCNRIIKVMAFRNPGDCCSVDCQKYRDGEQEDPRHPKDPARRNLNPDDAEIYELWLVAVPVG